MCRNWSCPFKYTTACAFKVVPRYFLKQLCGLFFLLFFLLCVISDAELQFVIQLLFLSFHPPDKSHCVWALTQQCNHIDSSALLNPDPLAVYSAHVLSNTIIKYIMFSVSSYTWMWNRKLVRQSVQVDLVLHPSNVFKFSFCRLKAQKYEIDQLCCIICWKFSLY